ncbi:hypothetical protein ACROYT_G043069 [Oculina patagonica]
MRRKGLLKRLLWLMGACVIVLGYVFYTFHSKSSSLKHFKNPLTIVDNIISEYSPIIISPNTIKENPTAPPHSRLQQLEKSTSFVNNIIAENSPTTFSTYTTKNTPTGSPIPNRQPPRRSLLIFGHDRSGTTFISAMFSKDPQMFMVYEPLWITLKWLYYERDYTCSHCELQVVNSILACNFTRSSVSTKFLSYISTPWTGALPVNIFTTPKFCNESMDSNNGTDCPELGKNPEFVDDVCHTKFKHSVVKVSPVRLPGEKMANLVPQVLLENPDVEIRVLHLVRDPRGNINSRINIDWLKHYPNPKLAYTARKLCDSIVANLDHADRTLTELKLKHKYKMVRYKQIADDPLGTAKDIYNFAGFDMPLETEKWIVESTKPSKKELKEALKQPYSTVRNATGNADKWRQDAFFERNRVIERECKPLMDKLGLENVSEPEGSSGGKNI